MDYNQYVQSAQQAAKHVEAGEHEQALAIFRSLVDSDISDLDKALMCYNMALVHEMRKREQDAISFYDRGVSYERLHGCHFVAEHRAGYFSRLGRDRESLRLYEDLLLRPSLTEEEKYRIRSNIDLLRDRIG